MRRLILLLALVLGCPLLLLGEPSGPLVEWAFDEGAGNVLKDKSGGGHDGRAERAEWIKSGAHNALLFDGKNSRVDCGDLMFPPKSGAFTFETWFNAKSMGCGSFGRIIQCGNASLLMSRDNGLEFSAFSKTASAAVPSKTWLHAAGVYDGREQRLYVNGVERAKVSAGRAEVSSLRPLAVGDIPDRSLKRSFDGMIGQAAVYDRALSREEIKARYEAGEKLYQNDSASDPNIILRGDFKDGEASLQNWVFQRKSGDASLSVVKPYPGINMSVAYIDFRKDGAWSLFSKNAVRCLAGKQYTLSANIKRYLGYGSFFRIIAKNSKDETLAKIPLIRNDNFFHELSAVFNCREDSDVTVGLDCSGYSEIFVAYIQLKQNTPPISSYETGMFVPCGNAVSTALYATGAFLEAEDLVRNSEALSEKDEDNDGKWAVINVDPADNPRLFSENTVIKSDSKSAEEGGVSPALILSVKNLSPGLYRALLSDPGRDIGVLADGKEWRRLTGGKGEADLGEVTVTDGAFTVCLSHRYRTADNPGPVYVDYLRFVPLYSSDKSQPRQDFPSSAQKSSGALNLNFKYSGVNAIPREKEWVTAGIPFAKGIFQKDFGVKIDGVSNLFAKPLVMWPDGSVKWLRLEFQADIKEGSGGVIECGKDISPAAAPVGGVTQKDGAYVMRCGEMEIHVKNGIWDRVFYKGKEIISRPPAVRLTTASGVRLNSLSVESVKIENPGPHPNLYIDGRLAENGKAGPFRFKARIIERAPQTLALVFSVINESDEKYQPDRGCGPAASLTELSLIIEAVRTEPAVVKWPEAALPLTDKAQTLFQDGSGPCVKDFDGKWSLSEGSKLVKSGKISAGWVDLPGKDSGLTVGVREFYEKCPKSISVKKMSETECSVEIGVWPREKAETLRYGQGTQLTTETAFVFYSGAQTDSERSSRLAPALLPARLTLSPEYYVKTDVLGSLPAKLDKRFSGAFDSAEKTFSEITEKNRKYGIEDWGDFFAPNGYVQTSTKIWTNNEWDFIAWLVMEFAARGDDRYLKAAIDMARHFANIDIIHYSSNKKWAGGSYEHTGDTREGHQVVPPDFAHAGWPNGLLWVYYMCGDELFPEAAKGLANYVINNMPSSDSQFSNLPYSGYNNMRQAGNPILTLCSVYELTGEPGVKRALDKIVDYSLRVQDPKTGCWITPVYEDPVYHRITASDGGLFYRGLYFYWTLTGDSRVAAAFNRMGRFFIERHPYEIRAHIRSTAWERRGLGYLGQACAASLAFSDCPAALSGRAAELILRRFPPGSSEVYGVRSAPGAFSACLQLAGAVERAKERSGGKSFPVTKILNDSAPWTAPAGELSTDTGGFLKYSPSSSGSCVLWRASAAENFIRRVILFFPDGIEKAVLLHCGSGIVFEALPGGWRVLDGGNPVRSEKVGESFWTENQTVFEFLRSGSDIALRLNGAMIYEGAKGKDASGGRIKLASEKDKVIIISTVEDSINAR